MNGTVLMAIWGLGVLTWGVWKWGQGEKDGGHEQAEISGIKVS